MASTTVINIEHSIFNCQLLGDGHHDDWTVKGDGTEKRGRPKPLMNIRISEKGRPGPPRPRYASPVDRLARKRVSFLFIGVLVIY